MEMKLLGHKGDFDASQTRSFYNINKAYKFHRLSLQEYKDRIKTALFHHFHNIADDYCGTLDIDYYNFTGNEYPKIYTEVYDDGDVITNNYSDSVNIRTSLLMSFLEDTVDGIEKYNDAYCVDDINAIRSVIASNADAVVIEFDVTLSRLCEIEYSNMAINGEYLDYSDTIEDVSQELIASTVFNYFIYTEIQPEFKSCHHFVKYIYDKLLIKIIPRDIIRDLVLYLCTELFEYSDWFIMYMQAGIGRCRELYNNIVGIDTIIDSNNNICKWITTEYLRTDVKLSDTEIEELLIGSTRIIKYFEKHPEDNTDLIYIMIHLYIYIMIETREV